MTALMAAMTACGTETENSSGTSSSNSASESSGSSVSTAEAEENTEAEANSEAEAGNAETKADEPSAEVSYDEGASSDVSAVDSEPVTSALSFREGVWEAEDCLYYFDADGASGRTSSYANKTGIGFMYEINEDGSAVFHMGAAEDNTTATVEFAGDSAFILWADGTETRLNFLLEYTDYNFENFYDDSQLIEIVKIFYTNEKGVEPSSVEITGSNGMYAPVDVFVNGEFATSYAVNRCTLYAYDTETNEEYSSIFSE